MSVDEVARRIADAVLYEGYALYPYRASALKNQWRWTTGVVVPREADATEPARLHAEVVLAGGDRVDATVRFLRAARRRVLDAGGRPVDRLDTPDGPVVAWDEADEQEFVVGGTLAELRAGGAWTHALPGEASTTPLRGGGETRRRAEELRLSVHLRAEAVGPDRHRVGVTVANVSDVGAGDDGDRDALMRRSLLGAHVLLTTDGRFASATAPPDEVTDVALHQEHAWPALLAADGWGPAVLVSPVILPDAATVAPRSHGDLYDGLEIEELLALRIATLTPAERAEAAALDPRVRVVVDRFAEVDAATLAPLHAAMRGEAALQALADDTDAAAATVVVEGQRLRPGSRVVLRPRRRADAHDLFLTGRAATVAAIHHDLDGGTHVGVTVDDDPGADLRLASRRYLWFAPDEVEVVTP